MEFVFPIKNWLVTAKFVLDVGLESEKYWKINAKAYIFQSALKKLAIFLELASGQLSENHKLFHRMLENG